jgi:AcrR family transcriptional regulator
LTRDKVLRSALSLAEKEGADNLTMRRLATQLGVTPNALYSYVSSKDELLDAVLDSLLADINIDTFVSEEPGDRIVELMVDSRRVLLSQADFLPQLFSRPMRGPNASRLAEVTLTLLAQLGVEGEEAVDGLRILLTHLFGSVALDAPRSREEDPEQRWADSEAAFAENVDQRHVAENARALARPPAPTTFENGLRWLLDGIEQRAVSRPRK